MEASRRAEVTAPQTSPRTNSSHLGGGEDHEIGIRITRRREGPAWLCYRGVRSSCEGGEAKRARRAQVNAFGKQALKRRSQCWLRKAHVKKSRGRKKGT